jgi:putative ABC transport system ATP-binding protein
MAILSARGLNKFYRVDHRRITVLNDVSLAVEDGEFLVIAGYSGSGKTTLLSILSGLDRPDSGSVVIQDVDITHLSEDRLAPFRNRVFGFVFQAFHLVPSLTALENVMFPAELDGRASAREEAQALLARVGLDERQDNLPHQLSGGEKQRVAICRALVNRPQIVFADEPTGNLDTRNGGLILDLLLEFQRELNSTLVLVTHNSHIAARADRKVTMTDGYLQVEKV